jgi:two-component system, OmpR family, response regulator MtrA
MIGNRNILVVDDDNSILQLIKGTLESEGFNVTLAGDGQSALDQIADSKPDLVLLDILMPGLNGFEVLKNIQEQSNIPVIMLTALDDIDALVNSFNLGAVDYIRKPFMPYELASRIKTKLRTPK